MKPLTTNVTVFFDDGQMLLHVLLDEMGQPKISQIGSRGDLPNVLFNTTLGDIWIKATTLVAYIVHAEDTTEKQLRN